MPEEKKRLTLENINPHVLKIEYAVRGPIVIRANELKEELNKKIPHPFEKVISANIGDCHAVGQKPLTFLRQLIAAVVHPALFTDQPAIFPPDVIEKAKRLLAVCNGSIGCYSESVGIRLIREDVARFIEQRDQLKADVDCIFLSTGASSAIKAILQLISSTKDGSERSGIMTPIPMYPLYSATISEYNAFQIDYYLDEEHGWGLQESELELALQRVQGQCQPRAIVVINPGNPTGQVLSVADMQAILRFVHRHGLLLLADEVYQQNVYVDDKKFHSFKKVLHEMGGDLASQVELASFFSVSKGYMGECGFRGGYCELVNIDPEVRKVLYKALSASLCSSTLGQAMMEAVVNHPQPGDQSYPLFVQERDAVLHQLSLKASLVTETFNSIPGFSCSRLEGAMYAFPCIQLPVKAVQAAQKLNQAPDFFYCLRLLEKTGICVVPGSGFGQREGTFHFRTTILPDLDMIKLLIEKIRDFHLAFLKEFSD